MLATVVITIREIKTADRRNVAASSSRTLAAPATATKGIFRHRRLI
jgi:hypothetical protein